MEGYIGQIVLFAGNFAPQNWAFCHGQIMNIAENTALFSIIGTMCGGNGTTNFALPDLRSRVPVGAGQGNGLSNVVEGEMDGSETTTLLISNMPMHTHNVQASNQFTGIDHPAGKYLGASSNDNGFYDDTANTSMAGDMIAPAGGNQPFDIRQPYLGLNYIICLYGIFPSRD